MKRDQKDRVGGTFPLDIYSHFAAQTNKKEEKVFSNKKWMTLIAVVAIAVMILPACAPPTPVVVEKEVPVEV
jgi:hypothetical protein